MSQWVENSPGWKGEHKKVNFFDRCLSPSSKKTTRGHPDGPAEHIFECFLPVPDGPPEHIFEGFLLVPDGPPEHIFEGFLPVPDGPDEHIFEGFLPVPDGPPEHIFEGFLAFIYSSWTISFSAEFEQRYHR